MTEDQSSRRKFLKILGLSAGTAMAGAPALAKFAEPEAILKLNPEQQAFMARYGEWMDEFIQVIRIQRTDRDNRENNQKMIALTEQATAFKPELDKFMKDEQFALIYEASIGRMSKEI